MHQPTNQSTNPLLTYKETEASYLDCKLEPMVSPQQNHVTPTQYKPNFPSSIPPSPNLQKFILSSLSVQHGSSCHFHLCNSPCISPRYVRQLFGIPFVHSITFLVDLSFCLSSFLHLLVLHHFRPQQQLTPEPSGHPNFRELAPSGQ